MSPLDKLTHQLSKLPGIGSKTALRLALYILRQPKEYAFSLSQSLQEVAEKVHFCSQCYHFSSEDLCSYCQDPKRDQTTVCIIEDSSDLMAIEKTKTYRGLYHVLQGSLSPLDGVGPEQLRIKELLGRLSSHAINEIVLATNPNVNGDATALYLSKLLTPMGLKITKLASGIPMGTQIEYIDQMTLSRAFEARQNFGE